jgi:hypothetical protein
MSAAFITQARSLFHLPPRTSHFSFAFRISSSAIRRIDDSAISFAHPQTRQSKRNLIHPQCRPTPMPKRRDLSLDEDLRFSVRDFLSISGRRAAGGCSTGSPSCTAPLDKYPLKSVIFLKLRGFFETDDATLDELLTNEMADREKRWMWKRSCACAAANFIWRASACCSARGCRFWTILNWSCDRLNRNGG